MQDLIARMRQFDEPFNPPATPEQLTMLEKALKIDALDDDLRALYLDHNGIPEYKNRHLIPLMPVDDVIRFAKAVEDLNFPPEVRFFWDGPESNPLGIYVSGVLKGKVFWLVHDDPDFAPRYRSVRSFLKADLDWLDARANQPYTYNPLPRDYPLLEDKPETDADDLALAEHFIRLYEQTPDGDSREYYAECAMNLLPFSASDKLIPFMHDNDMYIPACACTLAGQRKYLPAIPVLGQVVRKGRSNGDYAAIRALLSMGDEARAELRRAKQEMPPEKLYLLNRIDLS